MLKTLEEDQLHWNFLKGVFVKCPLLASSLVEGKHRREHSIRITAPRARVYNGRNAGRGRNRKGCGKCQHRTAFVCA